MYVCIDRQAHVDDQKDDEFPVVLAVVISLGILLFIVILIFCCVVFQLRRRYQMCLNLLLTSISFNVPKFDAFFILAFNDSKKKNKIKTNTMIKTNKERLLCALI